MVRFIDRDEYSNGKRYGVFEFTMAQTKEVIDLIQNPFLYCDIKFTLEQFEKLIQDVKETMPENTKLIENLEVVREQFAYQIPVPTSP